MAYKSNPAEKGVTTIKFFKMSQNKSAEISNNARVSSQIGNS